MAKALKTMLNSLKNRLIDLIPFRGANWYWDWAAFATVLGGYSFLGLFATTGIAIPLVIAALLVRINLLYTDAYLKNVPQKEALSALVMKEYLAAGLMLVLEYVLLSFAPALSIGLTFLLPILVTRVLLQHFMLTSDNLFLKQLHLEMISQNNIHWHNDVFWNISCLKDPHNLKIVSTLLRAVSPFVARFSTMLVWCVSARLLAWSLATVLFNEWRSKDKIYFESSGSLFRWKLSEITTEGWYAIRALKAALTRKSEAPYSESTTHWLIASVLVIINHAVTLICIAACLWQVLAPELTIKFNFLLGLGAFFGIVAFGTRWLLKEAKGNYEEQATVIEAVSTYDAIRVAEDRYKQDHQASFLAEELFYKEPRKGEADNQADTKKKEDFVVLFKAAQATQEPTELLQSVRQSHMSVEVIKILHATQPKRV